MIRGVSGGEKKRVTTGEMLVSVLRVLVCQGMTCILYWYAVKGRSL